MSTLVAPGRQSYPLECDRTFETDILRSERRIQFVDDVVGLFLARDDELLEVALDLGHTVLPGQHVSTQQSLKDVPDRWSVDQLQHKQVALQI